MRSQNYNKIINILKAKNFKNIELDSVIESKFILQRSGENFKKYLFSFYNSDGQELSLRPDLTISSVIRYIQNASNKKEKVFYTGSAFRKSYNKKNVVVRQIGMEIFSSKNEILDDKEIINTSLKILKSSKYKNSRISLGNFKLFELLIKKLEIPNRWKQRLLKFYWNEKYFSELLKRLESNLDIDPVVVAGDKKMYFKMIKQDLNKVINGRSYKDIIKRFEKKINDPRRPETGKKSAKIIKNFLKIKCPLKNAPEVLNKFFKKNDLNILVSKDFFPIKDINQKGLKFEFSTSIGRGREVEFYSSLIFSIDVKKKNQFFNLISGGRFNELTSKYLGLKKIPAVGAAVNLANYE